MIVELCVPIICKQTPWADLDREEKEQLDYEEMIAMIGQDGVNDEEESIKINEDQEVNIFEHLLSTNEIHLKKDRLQLVWLKQIYKVTHMCTFHF